MAMFIRYQNYFGRGLNDDLIDWNIEEYAGYTPLTTYYTDFSIADHFGLKAVKDTLKRAIKMCDEMGYQWQTELVMVLNWKIWEHYGRNDRYAEFYDNAWRDYAEKVRNSLEGDALAYYYRTID